MAERESGEEGRPVEGGSTVVYYDHAFSAGHRMDVQAMPVPHRHTQFEVNHVLDGRMVYSFESRRIALEPGAIALFSGMVPHQVVDRAPGTRFVCLYIPGALLMDLGIGDILRRTLFCGGFVEAHSCLDTDASCFRRWQSDLVGGDAKLGRIARDEIDARLRRLDHDGWTDHCRSAAPAAEGTARARPDKVEAMTRFIAEHWAEPLHVADVARAAGLHPNYAMALFRSVVGLTIADFLDRNRLDAACVLLASSDRDVTAVAFASGFGSLSSFYERFRSRFGITPAAFRRQAREG